MYWYILGEQLEQVEPDSMVEKSLTWSLRGQTVQLQLYLDARGRCGVALPTL